MKPSRSGKVMSNSDSSHSRAMDMHGCIWQGLESTSQWVKRGIKHDILTWMLLDLAACPWEIVVSGVILQGGNKSPNAMQSRGFRRAQSASPWLGPLHSSISSNLVFLSTMPSATFINETGRCTDQEQYPAIHNITKRY